jgi:multimeric flavodoxin WrbA
MVEILVVYHSQTGNTAKMARAVAEGVEAVDGAKVNLKHVLDADLEDLIQCDGLVVGSPEYFGYMSGLIKDFFRPHL